MTCFRRACGLLTCLVMLYLGATGVWLHLIDLRALVFHAPATDLTMQSIRAGEYGQENHYQVMTPDVFTAESLPPDLDYARALAVVLKAFHRAAPGAAPSFVELRVLHGATVGQARVADKQVYAFDARTGAAVAPTNVDWVFAPPSLRMDVKYAHRFWFHHEMPGVWFELLFGILACGAIVVWLVHYGRMLRERVLRGGALFWFERGWWRPVYFTLMGLAAALLFAISFSGAWIGFDSVYHHAHLIPDQTDASSPLDDAQAQNMMATALTIVRQHEPGNAIRVLRVRTYGEMPQGAAITGGAEPRQIVFDLATGNSVSLTEPEYPKDGFPLGLQMHEYVKYFHSFYLFGGWAQWFGLVAGMVQIFLSVTSMMLILNTGERRKLRRS